MSWGTKMQAFWSRPKLANSAANILSEAVISLLRKGHVVPFPRRCPHTSKPLVLRTGMLPPVGTDVPLQTPCPGHFVLVLDLASISPFLEMSMAHPSFRPGISNHESNMQGSYLC